MSGGTPPDGGSAPKDTVTCASAATGDVHPSAEPAAAPDGIPTPVARAQHGFGHRVAGYTRFFAAIPCLGLFVAAVAPMVSTFVSTVEVTVEVAQQQIGMQDMLVEYIEFADFFLLAIVLYIMSVGLYSLFIDEDVEMPSWLEIHTLDDLKEKLVSVIVVVMGVFFLGRLIHGAAALDLLEMGVGIGAVVLSLAYFVRHVMVAHK